MTKNLLGHITLSPEGLDDFEDKIGIERRRAQLERRIVGAQDAVIKAMFTDSAELDILLTLTPVERVNWIELRGKRSVS